MEILPGEIEAFRNYRDLYNYRGHCNHYQSEIGRAFLHYFDEAISLKYFSVNVT